MCSLPNGIRTGPVTNDVVADSRDQPHKRAQSTNAGTVTTTHGLPTRIARNARADPVPSTCEAAQPPRPLTIACRRRLTASASLQLSAAPDAWRSASKIPQPPQENLSDKEYNPPDRELPTLAKAHSCKEKVMTVYERTVAKIQQLPEPLLQEVSDFIDFLLVKQDQTQWELWTH